MNLTARKAIIWGFVISCVALVVNAIVLSSVTEKLQETEAAHAALIQSLNEQTNIKDEGEKKFESYRLNANLAPLLSETDREFILYDANSMFHDSILYIYTAGNDLSMTEFRRAETELELEAERNAAAMTDANFAADAVAKLSNTGEQAFAEKRKKESKQFEQAFKILENVRNEAGEVDYKAKHQAITVLSNLITESKDSEQKNIRFNRLNAFLNERFIESYDKKRLQIAELDKLRNEQSSRVSYSIFGSLILQMLGLVFIFLKDFIQDQR